MRNRWKRGPASSAGGAVTVSATWFLYRRWRYMPVVWFHGWRLRRAWPARSGAVGLFTAVETLKPVTYSLSVWASADDLRRFLRAPEHAKLMRRFKRRLAHSTSVVWEMEHFAPEDAWGEGLRLLARR